jgi:hypothetical protein
MNLDIAATTPSTITNLRLSSLQDGAPGRIGIETNTLQWVLPAGTTPTTLDGPFIRVPPLTTEPLVRAERDVLLYHDLVPCSRALVLEHLKVLDSLFFDSTYSVLWYCGYSFIFSHVAGSVAMAWRFDQTGCLLLCICRFGPHFSSHVSLSYHAPHTTEGFCTLSFQRRGEREGKVVCLV